MLRLAERIGGGGKLSESGADRAGRRGRRGPDGRDRICRSMTCWRSPRPRSATPPTRPTCLPGYAHETGVELRVLSGEGEARMTFLAVRRWFGWSAGRLLVLDIGGGSLEIGVGIDEEPDVALSLPLGAGRLSRTKLSGDPPHGRARSKP